MIVSVATTPSVRIKGPGQFQATSGLSAWRSCLITVLKPWTPRVRTRYAGNVLPDDFHLPLRSFWISLAWRDVLAYIKSLRLRLVLVLGLNVAIGLATAILLWWLQSRGNLHSLPAHLAVSAIHSVIYGTMFGLAMPYL